MFGCNCMGVFFCVFLFEVRYGILVLGMVVWVWVFGEFGLIFVFVGVIFFKIEVMLLIVFFELSYGNLVGVLVVLIFMVVFVFVVLLLMRIFGWWGSWWLWLKFKILWFDREDLSWFSFWWWLKWGSMLFWWED